MTREDKELVEWFKRAKPRITRLSKRDWARFNEIMDSDAEPNEALKNAAKEYKKRILSE